jgi:hypothetical protein
LLGANEKGDSLPDTQLTDEQKAEHTSLQLDPRRVDSGSTGYKLVAFALMLLFLSVLSYMSASNFDETELKLIGGMAVVTLLVLFAPDLARRYLPGGGGRH